jgi:hypothetical protein
VLYAAVFEHVLQPLDKLQNTRLIELGLLFSNLHLVLEAFKGIRRAWFCALDRSDGEGEA